MLACVFDAPPPAPLGAASGGGPQGARLTLQRGACLGCSASLGLPRQLLLSTFFCTLQLPAGLVDAGESAAEAAVRELREETGTRVVAVFARGWGCGRVGR